MNFYPTDGDRARVTELLVDDIDWLGDVPLILVHPGGGSNPVQLETGKRWPVERFALLGSRLVREKAARLLLVGGVEDRPLAEAVAGMMTTNVPDLAGRLTLGELGALCRWPICTSATMPGRPTSPRPWAVPPWPFLAPAIRPCLARTRPKGGF